MKLVRETYHTWGAEVVFVTSNFGGNKEIMEGCKAEGIPAFVSHTSLAAIRSCRLTFYRAHCGISERDLWSSFFVVVTRDGFQYIFNRPGGVASTAYLQHFLALKYYSPPILSELL